MCVAPVGAAAPRGPLPLCVPSEAQTRGCTMALPAARAAWPWPSSCAWFEGFLFASFSGGRSRGCACKQEFDQTGPDAQETAEDTEWGRGTEPRIES